MCNKMVQENWVTTDPVPTMTVSDGLKLAVVSDTHFGHHNIIKYCDRPFYTTKQMDQVMFRNMLDFELNGYLLIHLGDVSFNLRKIVEELGWLRYPVLHTVVIGNHDAYPKQSVDYRQCFGAVIGESRKTWHDNKFILDYRGLRLLMSHEPQTDLMGCDYNLHGHVHNNEVRRFALQNPDRADKEDHSWTLKSPKHINCCVEVHNYSPVDINVLLNG